VPTHPSGPLTCASASARWGGSMSTTSNGQRPSEPTHGLADAERWLKREAHDEDVFDLPEKRATAIVDEIDRLREENAGLRARLPRKPFDVRCADALADEVAVLVRRRVIDARSPAGDALLSYRDPPWSKRSDRMAALEAENAELRRQLEQARGEAQRTVYVNATNQLDALALAERQCGTRNLMAAEDLLRLSQNVYAVTLTARKVTK